MSRPIPIRDAATVIVVRDPAGSAAVLMGQRGANAAFMARKYVFPGGAVDAGDGAVPLARRLPEPDRTRANRTRSGAASDDPADALAAAAIRELWEETGQIAGRRGEWTDPPDDWRDFAATGHRPDAGALRYIFRAITPVGRPRRFDARFFMLDACELAGDPDDFGAAGDELSHLSWVPLAEVRGLDLPFVTTVALGELAAALPRLDAPRHVPVFRNEAPWDVSDDAAPD